MGVHLLKAKDTTLEEKQNDKEKAQYLFFHRLFFIEDIERYFKGKYTYNEIRAMVREKYTKYIDKENVNGR